MTNQPFLYDAQANVLRQRAEMDKPEEDYYMPGDNFTRKQQDEYWKAKRDYDAHIASLPAYTPVSGWVPEVGKEYVEEKDFELREVDADEITMLGMLSYRKKVAVPIEQKQEGVVTGRARYGKTFTISDMMKAYDAGCGDVNGTEKEKYFKNLKL